MSASLPPGWSSAQASDGRAYYYNSSSGETRWERPGGDESAPAPAPAGALTIFSKPNFAPAASPKPTVPAGVAGIGKLPKGWRMGAAADGKTYYYKKDTGEVSWEPPPPDAEGSEETMQDKVKEGWRRTKQQAAAKVFKTASVTQDPELDSKVQQMLQVEMQFVEVKKAMEAYMSALVEMLWAGEQVTQRLCDYTSEDSCPLLPASQHASRVWHDLQAGARRSLEQQFQQKALTPVHAYLHYLYYASVSVSVH